MLFVGSCHAASWGLYWSYTRKKKGKNVEQTTQSRAEHSMGRAHIDYFLTPELIGADRVDHQLYPGMFAYLGPRCGSERRDKQQIQQYPRAVIQQEEGKGDTLSYVSS